MAIIFRYAPMPREDGLLVKAPCIRIRERDDDGKCVEITALVDSGADSVVIPKDLAELLGLKLGEETETGGIGGKTKARKAQFSFVLRKGRESYPLTMPALVLTDESIDIPLILGRNGFFEHFDITFKQAEEKIVLKKVAAQAY